MAPNLACSIRNTSHKVTHKATTRCDSSRIGLQATNRSVDYNQQTVGGLDATAFGDTHTLTIIHMSHGRHLWSCMQPPWFILHKQYSRDTGRVLSSVILLTCCWIMHMQDRSHQPWEPGMHTCVLGLIRRHATTTGAAESPAMSMLSQHVLLLSGHH